MKTIVLNAIGMHAGEANSTGAERCAAMWLCMNEHATINEGEQIVGIDTESEDERHHITFHVKCFHNIATGYDYKQQLKCKDAGFVAAEPETLNYDRVERFFADKFNKGVKDNLTEWASIWFCDNLDKFTDATPHTKPETVGLQRQDIVIDFLSWIDEKYPNNSVGDRVRNLLAELEASMQAALPVSDSKEGR